MALEGAEAATDQNRRALLDAINQQQGIGAQAYQNEGNRQQQARTEAMNSLTQQAGAGSGGAAPSGLLRQTQAAQAALANTYRNDLSLGQQSYNAAMSGAAGLNDAYFKQAAAAVPALRAQAEGQVRLIQEQIAAEREQRQIQLQMQREQLEADREQRAAEKAELQAANGGLPPDEAANLEGLVSKRQADAAGMVAAADPTGGASELFAGITAAQPSYRGALQQLQAFYDYSKAEHTKDTTVPAMSEESFLLLSRALNIHYKLGTDLGDLGMIFSLSDGQDVPSNVAERFRASLERANPRPRNPSSAPPGTYFPSAGRNE